MIFELHNCDKMWKQMKNLKFHEDAIPGRHPSTASFTLVTKCLMVDWITNKICLSSAKAVKRYRHIIKIMDVHLIYTCPCIICYWCNLENEEAGKDMRLLSGHPYSKIKQMISCTVKLTIKMPTGPFLRQDNLRILCFERFHLH